MHISHLCLTAMLASGVLLASDVPQDYSWLQLQGGVTGHRSNNDGDRQPAFGAGLGTWATNGHVGVELSALGTWVDYGYGKSQETHLTGSMLFNPFSTPANVRPFLRLGIGGTSMEAPLSGVSDRSTRLSGVLGLGLQALVGPSMLFTVEGRLVEIQSMATRKEAQLLAGIGWHFGGTRRPVAVVETPAPAPAPVPVVVVAPVPVVVTVPVAEPTQQYCTILDVQFSIDRDDLQKEDTEKLAVLGTFMTKYPNTTAVIEGHSDNVGNPEHNLDLSQRRAESVVRYLSGTLNIAPTRLKAVGYGETRPLADNGTQAGMRQNRRINAVIGCVTDVEGLTVAPARVTMALYIDFDRNKSNIKPEYDGALNKVAVFLKANPTVTATMEGHTGNLQVTQEKAIMISQQRAQSVVDYLVDHFGIDRARLSARGLGEAQRFAYNTSAEGQQENRRVNIIINYPAK